MANVNKHFDKNTISLKKGVHLKTIPSLSKSWTLSVDIHPLNVKSDWASIVHATTGENIEEYGSRVPGIWFHPETTNLYICSAVNGNLEYPYNHPTPLPMNVFTNVKVEQVKKDGDYLYRIYVAGEKVHEVVNNQPSDFRDVKLYASDPWHKAAKALVRCIEFDNNIIVLERDTHFKTISTLSKSWTLSVDIKPIGTKSDYASIIHATTGENIEEYGSRVPGIWFHPDTTNLYICSAVNGNLEHPYNHPTPLPMNVFTNVKVEQIQKDGNYLYRVHVAGEKVHEVVNNQPSNFNNVKLYTADPWHKAAASVIRKLEFVNNPILLEKEHIFQTISKLSKSWTLSVDIKPIGTKSDYASIIHATTGENIEEYGSRVPGIWFHPDTTNLYICSAVNGNLEHPYNHPTPLPMNVFTNVKVEQIQKDGNYLYKIYVAGEKVHKIINNQPSMFHNVKLYASDPWHKVANAMIRNLEFYNQ